MAINLITLSNRVKAYLSKIAVISDPKLQQLSALPSFAARIRFCDANWPKIAAGTGRIAYDYSPDLILKLAKNEKGQQQNITENDGVIQDHYTDIVAKVEDSDPDDLWMVVEKAKKITPTQFKSMIGVDINDFKIYLEDRIKGRKPTEDELQRKELHDKLDNNEFAQELLDMMVNFGMPIGDFGRLSSYGMARGRVVCVDYGLTEDIWDQYYK